MPKDHPVAFDDVSWLAVRSDDLDRILGALDLSDPIETSWKDGIETVLEDYDEWEPDNAQLSRVYITPLVGEWRLLVGGWFFGALEEDLEDDECGSRGYKTIAKECKKLSKLFGEAHAFTSQGRMDLFAWTLARDGKIIREYLWEGSAPPLVDKGERLVADANVRRKKPIEGQKRQRDPSITMATKLAGEVSINPLKLSRKTKTQGKGYLALTAWGREHGVPKDDS